MRTSAVRACVLAAMLGIARPAVVCAQEPAAAYVDKPVASVAILIEEKPSADPSLTDLIDTKVGAPLSMSDVRESITHLYGLGRFEDVRVDAMAAPAGVALTYRLEPIHPVTKVQFRGDLQMSDSALRSRMVDRFGATPPASRAAEVAVSLEQLYQERGYLRATVKPAPPVLEHEPDRATLVFDVEAGPRARVAKVDVQGSPPDPVPSIVSQLGLTAGAAYEPADLRSRIDKYIQSMRRRGYYQASVTDSRQVSDDGRDVTVTITVNPGPAVTVRFEGDQLSKDKIAELVPIEREGSVDPDLIEDSAQRIRDYFRAEGYWKADVEAERRENDGHLTIVFTISRGALYHVAPGGIDVTGNKSVPTDRIRALLRLNAGDPFVESRLDVSIGAIQGLYQSEGFANVQVKSEPNEVGPGLVKPAIVITEGSRTLVGSVSVEGNRAFPTPALLSHVESKPGALFYAPRVRDDRDAIFKVYLDAGYQSAQVNEETVASSDGKRADLRFKVVEGPQVIVDHILIVGNARTKASVIQRELQFAPGKPLGVAALVETRRRLSALGLFRRIDITQLAHGSPTERDVLITVEEALQTSIGYGGGVQLDRRLRLTDPNGQAQEVYEFAPRGFFEISRRNLGGRNRTASLYTRISLRPNDQVGDTSLFGFSEYRVVGTYLARQVLPGGGDFTTTAAVEQGVRSSFNFTRKGINADFTRQWSPRLRTSVRYALSTTHVFDENFDPGLDPTTFDRVFGQLRLSTFSGAVSRDTRDDLLEPQRGLLLSLDTSFAAKAIGSQAGYLKSLGEAFFYRNLGRPRLVLAGGIRLGLANAFKRIVEDPALGPQEIRELPASERFFTGGDTTIRGYATDTVGAPNTIAANGFPSGGNAMIILNAELRTPVFRDLGAAVFIDGGNVFLHTSEMNLGELRGSVGFGVRYRSPVGPIRLDIGFKLDRRTIGGRLEPRTVLHFSIGQAF